MADPKRDEPSTGVTGPTLGNVPAAGGAPPRTDPPSPGNPTIVKMKAKDPKADEGEGGGYEPQTDLAHDEIPDDPIEHDEELVDIVENKYAEPEAPVAPGQQEESGTPIGLVLSKPAPTAAVAKAEAAARSGYLTEDPNRIKPSDDRIEVGRANQRARHKLFEEQAAESGVAVAEHPTASEAAR